MYGLEIAAQTGLKPPTTYTIMERLESHGWVRGDRETTGRPVNRRLRHYYRLTDTGLEAAQRAQGLLESSLQSGTSMPASGEVYAIRTVRPEDGKGVWVVEGVEELTSTLRGLFDGGLAAVSVERHENGCG